MIPKLIHQIWINDSDVLPKCYKQEFIRSWKDLHPEWEYRLWLKSDIDELIDEVAETFPGIGRCWNDIDNRAKPKCKFMMKADVFKHIVMYQFGGIVVDLDVKCLKTFDHMLDNDCAFMNNSTQFFMAPPNQPVFRDFIAEAVIPAQNFHQPLKYCGPYALSRFLESKKGVYNYVQNGHLCLKTPCYKVLPDDVLSIHYSAHYW